MVADLFDHAGTDQAGRTWRARRALAPARGSDVILISARPYRATRSAPHDAARHQATALVEIYHDPVQDQTRDRGGIAPASSRSGWFRSCRRHCEPRALLGLH